MVKGADSGDYLTLLYVSLLPHVKMRDSDNKYILYRMVIDVKYLEQCLAHCQFYINTDFYSSMSLTEVLIHEYEYR